jgi:small Trp-rich protein
LHYIFTTSGFNAAAPSGVDAFPVQALGREETSMYFVVLGLLLIVMKLAEFGPVAEWQWGWVLSPFVGAFIWWIWADSSGYTKRKEVEKMDLRVAKRREENLEKLGMDKKGRRHGTKRK